MTTEDDDGETISLERFLAKTPLDQALGKIFAEFDLDRMGGASKRGWSNRHLLLACPYKYKRLTLDGAGENSSGGGSTALEVGGLLHQLLALYYVKRMAPERRDGIDVSMSLFDPEWLTNRLLDEGVSGEAVMEARRLYSAYTLRYEDDYLEPLAAEIAAEDKQGNTCRYDLICRIVDNDVGMPLGTIVCEHKTTARFDMASLQGWRNDGQILQQIMLWQANPQLAKTFGPLLGVMVNIVGKQKQPQFHRTLIPIQRQQLAGHKKDLKVWDAMEGVFRATGTWPRNRASCVTRYGLCNLFDECAGA